MKHSLLQPKSTRCVVSSVLAILVLGVAFQAQARIFPVIFKGTLSINGKLANQGQLLTPGDKAEIEVTSRGMPISGVEQLIGGIDGGTLHIRELTLGDPEGDACYLSEWNLKVRMSR